MGQTPVGVFRPRGRVSRSRRLLWLPLAMASCGVVAYAFLLGDTGYLRERALRRELARLEARIRELEAEGEHLRARLAELQVNGGALERIGREQLGLVRPGEVSYRLVPMVPEGWSLDSRQGGAYTE